MSRSCADCPARLTDEGAAEFFGRNFGPGVDVCGIHGHVLGKPGLAESAVLKIRSAFAESCSTFGEPLPSQKPAFAEARVAIPDPSVYVNDDGTPRNRPTPEEQAQVRSCNGCANFVPAPVVKDELGWHLGLCAANGRLLLNERLTSEPRACGQARPGATRDSTDGIALLPPYEEAFKFGAVRIESAPTYDLDAKFIEPTEYETDAPVSEADRAHGIRAWRKFTDGSGLPGHEVLMPVFDPEFFDEEERAKIPRTGDDEHPEFYIDHDGILYDLAVEMMSLDETPVLIGPAGVGKTEIFRHLAWLLCLPFDRISITKATEIDDLAGKWLFEDGQTRWQNGRLVNRWEKPGVLLIDEPNLGRNEVWEFIRPMTDNSKQLVLDAARGQKSIRNPFCFFGLAMNPAWDMKNVGAQEISDADGNRLAAIAVDIPPEDVERAILKRRCAMDGYDLPADVLDKIMSIAADIRALTDPMDGTLPISWGIRPQIAVARKTRHYPLAKAYRRAICDRLEPAAAQTILGIVSSYDES